MQQLKQVTGHGSSLTRATKSLLRFWYRKRFVRHQDTSMLMETISDYEDRRALSIVALLDVDKVTMTGLMDAEELQFVKMCHSYLTGRRDG